MANARGTLRQVGIALLVVGLLDIGVMAYCIATGRSYSSSLNVFAVIAGIFLIRGSIAAARVVTWFSAFLLAGLVGALVVLLPLTQPLDLLITQFRLDPAESLLAWLFAAVMLAVLVWVYRRLRSPEVIQARVEAGQRASPPRLAFALGIGLVIFLAAMLHFTMSGENLAKAVELAKSREGPGYKYHVTGMRWNNSTVHATVAAYNDHEIRSVNVEWQR
jgi:hypothetical protein